MKASHLESHVLFRWGDKETIRQLVVLANYFFSVADLLVSVFTTETKDRDP
jgi:hypothetical protein